jgi:hypothetical protein
LSAVLVEGVRWFDAEAAALKGAPFRALAPADQIVLLETAEAKSETAGGRLFALLRQKAMRHYYAHPRIIASFNYAGPSQPNGFPDFAQRPRGS